jgi:hypothetical protein
MAGTHIYIDGLNFYYGAVRHTNLKWFDFASWAKTLVPKDTVGRVHYFTALVRSQYDGDRSPERHNALLRAIECDPLVEVHRAHFTSDAKWRPLAEGKYGVEDLFRPRLRPKAAVRLILREARRRRRAGVTLTRIISDEEKRSDVSLASHLVYEAATGACNKAIIVTNDSDLMEPIVLACQAGIPVGLVNPHREPTNRRLKQSATFEIPFRREALKKCLLPNTVKTPKGKELHCPKEWR